MHFCVNIGSSSPLPSCEYYYYCADTENTLWFYLCLSGDTSLACPLSLCRPQMWEAMPNKPNNGQSPEVTILSCVLVFPLHGSFSEQTLTTYPGKLYLYTALSVNMFRLNAWLLEILTLKSTKTKNRMYFVISH